MVNWSMVLQHKVNRERIVISILREKNRDSYSGENRAALPPWYDWFKKQKKKKIQLLLILK